MNFKFLKFLFTTLVIIITIFSFTVSSFAVYEDILEKNTVLNKIASSAGGYFNSGGVICKITDETKIEKGYAYVVLCGYSKPVSFEFDVYGYNDNKLYVIANNNRVTLNYYDVNGDLLFSGYGSGSYYYSTDYTIDDYLYSNVEIKNHAGELVNPQTPPVQGVILEEVEQIPQAMIQVLQKIIPVGLVILSTVLLISLIQLVLYRMR